MRKMFIALMVVFSVTAHTAEAGWLEGTRNVIGYAFFKPVNCITQISGKTVSTLTNAGADIVGHGVEFVKCVVDNLVSNPIE